VAFTAQIDDAVGAVAAGDNVEQDGYMPEESARAYLRDLPQAELHLLDGGHWALETNLDEIVTLVRDFLGRVHGSERGNEA